MATRRRICRIRVLAENSPVWRIRVLAKMAILANLGRFAICVLIHFLTENKTTEQKKDEEFFRA